MNGIWANRLIAGTQTWERCVKVGRGEAVTAVLKKRVENGVITAEKYKEITGEVFDVG